MRYKQASLFRTPLKSDLSEVFDGFTSKSQYLQFLRGAYPNDYAVNSAIDFPLRAIKTRDLDTTLVITMSNQIIGSQKFYKDFNPLDWNYCALTYQYYDYTSSAPDHLVNDVKFYFITGAESLNDDPKRGTCKLYLTEDCWANYYLDFAGSNDTHTQFMHRSTQNLIGSTSGSTDYIINKGVVPNLKPDNHSYYYIDDDCILSLAVRLSFDQIENVYGCTDHDNPVTQYNWIFGSDKHQSNTPIFYYPLCSLTNPNDSNVQFKLTYLESGVQNTINIGNFNADNYQLPDIVNAVGCIDAWVTCYGVHAKRTTQSGTSTPLYTMIEGTGAVDVKMKDGKFYRLFICESYNFTKTDNFVNGLKKDSTVYTNIQDIINHSEYYCTYPFSALSVYINGKTIPINVTNTESCTFNITRNGKSAPYFTYEIGGMKSTRFLINEGLKVARVTDSLEAMLSANSNQIQSKRNMATMDLLRGLTTYLYGVGLASVTTGPLGGVGVGIAGAFGTAGAMGSFMNINAQIADADNRLDVSSIPTLSGTDAVFFDALLLDRAFVNDYNTNMVYYHDMHYKGCYFDQPELLTKNYKEVFDYSQTLECSIPQVKNPLARERLEQAYNRGITRFHIKTVDDELYDYVINMEKDVTNRSV